MQVSAINKIILSSLCAASVCISAMWTEAKAGGRCLTAAQLKAKYGGVENRSRCGGPIPPGTCQELNSDALEQNVVCPDGLGWLESERLCAISFRGHLAGICPMGCFEASTELSFIDDSYGLSTVLASEVRVNDMLATLEEGADLTDPSLTNGRVSRVVSGPEEPDLYVFVVSGGAELAVTGEHAMVLYSGAVARAADVEVGDVFVTAQGDAVVVEQIVRRQTQSDVFNFDMDGTASENHVLVANGLFVGDLILQSSTDEELASIALR